MTKDSFASQTGGAAHAGPTPVAAGPLAAMLRRLDAGSLRIRFDEVQAATKAVRRFDDHHTHWAENGAGGDLYVLADGFAYSFSMLTGGKRHIDDFFGPGAICNWGRIKPPELRRNVFFKPGSSIAVLDGDGVARLLGEKPDLADLLERQALAQTLRGAQRVRTLISLTAPYRVAILLLDLVEEYRAVGIEDQWLPLPFNQQEIGDIVGLTVVHVSRTMAKLESEGMLERNNGDFRLPREEELRRHLDYRRHFVREEEAA